MKKLLAVLALFLLVGCSDAYASPSTNDVLFEVNGVAVKKDDLFTAMKARDAGKQAIEDGQTYLTQDVTDEEIAEKVESTLAKQRADFGELFDAQLKMAGYTDENDYVERSLKPYLRLQSVLRAKLTEDYDAFALSFKPRKLQIIQLSSREVANQALEKLTAGSSFDDVASEFNSGTTFNGEPKIFMMNDTKIPAEVTQFVVETNVPTRSDIIETTAGEVKFYIVNVIEPDVTKIKEDAIEAGLEVASITQQYIAKMYRDAGFRVFDRIIFDLMQADFKDYLAN